MTLPLSQSATSALTAPAIRSAVPSFRAKRGISCAPRHSVRVSAGVAKPRNLSCLCRSAPHSETQPPTFHSREPWSAQQGSRSRARCTPGSHDHFSGNSLLRVALIRHAMFGTGANRCLASTRYWQRLTGAGAGETPARCGQPAFKHLKLSGGFAAPCPGGRIPSESISEQRESAGQAYSPAASFFAMPSSFGSTTIVCDCSRMNC
jgi:hypothetical protein